MESMDEEELAAYKDWDMYIPEEFKRNDIIYCLNAKFDAGKKLDILDKALQKDEKWNKAEKKYVSKKYQVIYQD